MCALSFREGPHGTPRTPGSAEAAGVASFSLIPQNCRGISASPGWCQDPQHRDVTGRAAPFSQTPSRWTQHHKPYLHYSPYCRTGGDKGKIHFKAISWRMAITYSNGQNTQHNLQVVWTKGEEKSRRSRCSGTKMTLSVQLGPWKPRKCRLCY